MKPTFFSLFLSALVIFGVGVAAAAQAVNNQYREEANLPPQPSRPSLVGELNLSGEQIDRLRRINRQFQPPLRQARLRMQAANQALDEAVYGGQDNAVIQSRLKEAQMAHSEWIKARTDSESAITAILTRNQLTRFRELRQRNKQAAARNRQLTNQTQPVPGRLNRLQRQIRNNRRLAPRNNF